MPAAKPNIFQRVTLQWDCLHPYNAAQVMELAVCPPADALQATWHESLRDLGLNATGPGVLPDLAHVDETLQLDAHLTTELNRRFDRGAPGYSPFRPFVRLAGEGCYLGVVYHHWAADSASIRLLLREWFLRLFRPDRARRKPLVMPAGGFWRYFGPESSGWHLGDALSDSLRWSAKLKKVRRIESPDWRDLSTAFSHHATPEGLVAALLPAVRSRRATLNDLFLAVIAQACDRFGPVAPTARRTDLAMGTIVDLRGPRPELADAFGLFLGFTNALVRPRDLASFPNLVDAIARQNAHNKRAHAGEASIVRMSLGLLAGRFYRHDKLVNWYRKRLPLAGGVSNVNLDRDWPSEYRPAPLRNFIRVSPAGPSMPLVFTPTTLGGNLEFGLTVRNALVPPDRALAMAQFFTQRLVDVANYGVR